MEDGRPRGCGGCSRVKPLLWDKLRCDVSNFAVDALADVGVPGITSSGREGGGSKVSE